MSSIPLPAMHVDPVQVPDMIGNYTRILQLKNMMENAPLQQQLLQQQVQEGQQNMAARQALNQAYAGAMTKDQNGNPTFDSDKLMQNLSQGPAAYKSPEVLEGITKFQKGRIDLQTAATDLQTKSADMLGNAASAIKAAGYDPTLAHSLLDTLPQSPQIAQVRQQIDNPQALKQMVDSAIQNSPKQRELGAQETTANARQTTAQTEKQKLDASMNPQSSLYAPSPASVALGTAPGAAQIQAGEVTQAAKKAGAEEAARMPGEMALARQRQALSQGDPDAAAQLLIDGNATLSELKSRGATPDFIAKTLTAANKKSNGTYNAQAAEAQFDVAKSPANQGFFGSAKSLTDKGGTVDQLAEAAKNIPKNQIPAFNSLADWTKASLGNGPLAEYAARVLGVADDYSKVMGGGVGSDSSRLQAANLVSAKLSQEGLDGAINGIRGSVNSQITSRIGNNAVLQRMYGSGGAASAQPQPSASRVIMRAPNGQTKAVSADQVAHYKQLGATEVQ